MIYCHTESIIDLCEEVDTLAEDKKTLGRPKSEKPKNHPVTIRLDEQEYTKLKIYAKSQEKTITQIVMEGLKTVIPDKE